jgi:hypothetical protein
MMLDPNLQTLGAVMAGIIFVVAMYFFLFEDSNGGKDE